jgi:ribonucleoside-diphosphate reductase alpha chain
VGKNSAPAQITDAQGNVIFETEGRGSPKDWSMTATNIVASKYLHGTIGRPNANPACASWYRVAETIRDWGKWPATSVAEDAATSTTNWLISLRASTRPFNSPVWFNVGCDRIEPNSDAQNWHWNPRPRA